MKNTTITTTSHFFHHSEMLRYNAQIAALDFTANELNDFADFVRQMGEWWHIRRVEEIYRMYEWKYQQYMQTIELVPVEELEDPANTWIDEEFMNVKLYVQDMVDALTEHPYFNEFRA